jgi:hypothetical protein
MASVFAERVRREVQDLELELQLFRTVLTGAEKLPLFAHKLNNLLSDPETNAL